MKYSDVESEPTVTEFLLMDDYDAGDEAYINGVPLTDNPHPAGSNRAIAWSDGWQTAAGEECPDCGHTETESNGGTEYRCCACDHRWGFDCGERYGF